MGLYPVAVCYNARQDNTVQYKIIQYTNSHHKITYNTQGNVLYPLPLKKKTVRKTYTLLRLRNK